MFKMSKKLIWVLSSIVLLYAAFCIYGCSRTIQVEKDGFTYEKVKGDPLNARIYTLDNGLKVYMSVYKDEPRLQATVVVRVGAKNDPARATGLAHCVEHLMFKGTDEFGTADYKEEKKELKKIAALFETYRQTADSLQRKRIYNRIDSISFIASKYAIAGEYDNMMGSIGATGTNAYTSWERTVYKDDIPANKIAQWLAVGYERFADPVFRIFHTELEAICEEKNIDLDSDYEKARNALDSGLWQKHPYGTQTILGSVEDLKNPSIKNVQDYFDTYYVPNNMAICLSGDFDPDSVIQMIDKTFGKLSSAKVPKFVPPVEDPITDPVVKEVYGPDMESVSIGYRFPGIRSREADLLLVTDWIMMNNVAGIMDLNLKQEQKVISPFCYPSFQSDYSKHLFTARPREGQSLEEVKDLLLSQVELLKKGEFPDWLPAAASNVLKMIFTESEESNRGRTNSFIDAFINKIPWEEHVTQLDRLEKITKQDIVEFANKYYTDNYVVVYKRKGKSEEVKKITMHEITPVELNRDAQSNFVKAISDMGYPEIEPVFLDFDRDMSRFEVKQDISVLYKRNTENDLFELSYVLNMGQNHNRKLDTAMEYFPYLGTNKYTNKEFKQELFKNGCMLNAWASDDRIHVSLYGLGEKFEEVLRLLEDILSDARPDKEALEKLVEDIVKNRADNKLNKYRILRMAMKNYAMYGKQSPYTNILSTEELFELDAKELVDIIKHITDYKHRIVYYGPHGKDELARLLNKYHNVPGRLKAIPEGREFAQLPMKENIVYTCDYDMKQARIIFLSKSAMYNKKNAPLRELFNEYYGGNMGSIVFQTLRESKALAYSVWVSYTTPDDKDEAHYIYSYIGTQADKMSEAMAGMYGLLNEFPESRKCLKNSKEGIISKLRTERITKSDVLNEYEERLRLGIEDYDIRENIYREVTSLEMNDLKAFFNRYIKGRKYAILVLGDTDKLDYDALAKYGRVKQLTLEEVFGY